MDAAADLTVDSQKLDSGSAYVTSLLGHSPSTLGIGTYGSKTAITNAVSAKGTEWTIILSPSGSTLNQSPTATFTSSCTALTCSFDARGSDDPDGSITDYSWDFGDTSTPGSTAMPSHTYAAPGNYPVTLTVTDNSGATGTVTESVTATAPRPPIGFVGANQVDGATASDSVSVPDGAGAGDALLLYESFASTTVTTSSPKGWTLVGTTTNANLTANVYSKTAVAGEGGSSVTATFSAPVKASFVLADYMHAALPVEAALSATSTGTSHVTPAQTALSSGSWVVSYWTDKSTTTSVWTLPAGVTQRAAVFGTGGAADGAVLGDSDGASSGSYNAQTATSNASSGSAAQWSIALAPAG